MYNAFSSLSPLAIIVVSVACFLLVGVGLVVAREGTNFLFDGRPCRQYMIVAGHDVVLPAVPGAILAVWR